MSTKICSIACLNKAKMNPKLRAANNLQPPAENSSENMLNALYLGTKAVIRKHPKSN